MQKLVARPTKAINVQKIEEIIKLEMEFLKKKKESFLPGEIKKPIKEKVLEENQTIWIEPKLICEIQYASMTKDGAYREGVFVRLRPDLG